MKIRYTKHAQEMLAFRKIRKQQVENTIKEPDDDSQGRGDKIILYKNFGKNYLKVVISREEEEVIVITEHWIAKKRIKK